MDDHASVFPYLGQDMLNQQLVGITNVVQKCFPVGSQGFNQLAKYTKTLVQKREKWPEKIFSAWQHRKIPAYSEESITKCNTARVSQINLANQQRQRLQVAFTADITRLKKKVDDIHRKRDTSEEKYNEKALSSTAHLQLLGPRDLGERLRVTSELRSAYDSYRWTINRLETQERALYEDLRSLENEMIAIQTVSTHSNQKQFVLLKGNSLLGWLPGEEKYILIRQPKCPPKDEVFRHVSFEPESGLSNLPLSIYNLIIYADEIGATDDVLLNMLTSYLRKHKPTILDVLDTKKNSIAAIMEILSYHCSTEPEKQAVLQNLKHFKRDSQETFASAVTRFESLYVFWLQLDTPHTVDNIKTLSYEVLRQITQYLLSPKCATAFGKWSIDTTRQGIAIDKDTIIRTVSQLEAYADLKLQTVRTLPGTLITTTLGLPIQPMENDINAHFVNPPKPVDIRPSARPSSTGRPRTPNNSSRNASSNRSNSGSRNTSASRSTSKTPRHPSAPRQQAPRSQSKSPRRDYQKDQRGRSPEKSANVHLAEMDPELECLQYYSRYSTSSNEQRKQSIPTIFRRALTPKTKAHLQTTYFFSTSGDSRFKDVRTKKNCLRCYGSTHKAADCKTYTDPCPWPCRKCLHLFHPTDKCKFFDSQGKSKPPSRSNSLSRQK